MTYLWQPLSELELREWLWLNHHGHYSLEGLYGDDGEMQCALGHVLDFKRQPILDLLGAIQKTPGDDYRRINCRIVSTIWTARELLKDVLPIFIQGDSSDLVEEYAFPERSAIVQRIEQWLEDVK